MRAAEGFGYPGTPPRFDGAWVDLDLKGQVASSSIQVESRGDQSIKAQPGYSGSPVWSDTSERVVGLLHASAFVDEVARDAYLVPPGRIAEIWPEHFDYLLVPPNPYRGLEPFIAEHASAFFGRDAEIRDLHDRVLSQPVTVVIGPSGVGKSSLVQAGLIPRLRESQPWAIAVSRPGSDPWHRLASSLLHAQQRAASTTSAHDSAPLLSQDQVEAVVRQLHAEGLGPIARFMRSQDRPLLIIVDQLEEALALGPLEEGLLELLLPLRKAESDALRVVLTLRADFLPTLLQVPGAGKRLDGRTFLVSPLTSEQVRKAVELPAESRGVKLEPGLIDRIVNDTAAHSLPLLQFTLTQLWETQRHKLLTFAGYHNMGGVAGALDRFAEERWSAIGAASQAVLDRVLLSLILTPADDPKRTTRQRVYQADLPPEQWLALQHLASARLVIADTGSDGAAYAELAHEALITSWRRLWQLVIANTDFLGWLDRVRRRAADGDALPESRIEEARRWILTRPDDVPASVRQFIARSEAIGLAERRELEAAREKVDASSRQSEVLRIWSQFSKPGFRDEQSRALLLALNLDAYIGGATPEGDRALQVLTLSWSGLTLSSEQERLLGRVAYSREASQIASAGLDGFVRLFDATKGDELAEVRHKAPISALAFARDGSRLASGSADGVVAVLDVSSNKYVMKAHHSERVRDLAFIPDGTRGISVSQDGDAQVFDAVTGEPLWRHRHGGPVEAVSYSPSGDLVATGSREGIARILHAANGSEVMAIPCDESVTGLTFSPDESRLIVLSRSGLVRIINMATGLAVAQIDKWGIFTLQVAGRGRTAT